MKTPLPESLIKLQALCSFITKKTLAQVFSCKSCEISKNTFSNWSHERDCRKACEGNPVCLINISLVLKVSRPSLKAFSKQYYLKAVKIFHNDQNCQLNEKNRGIRNRKATQPARKDFELLFLFEISSESEILSENHLLTWSIFEFTFWNLS